MRHALRVTILAALIALVAIGVALLFSTPARAQGPTLSDKECLGCHSNPDQTIKLPSGEPLSLYVDAKALADSVHGKKDISCVQCHSNITAFPHPAFVVADRRDVTLKLYGQCRQCHAAQYARSLDSVHTRAIAAGDRNAAVCTDCHTFHTVTPPDQPRAHIPQTCAQCHSTIFDDYAKSVHGSDVMTGANPDVPTCVDCHGVHVIGDPTTAAFRLKSPEVCARCHTNKAMMAKYKISTNVLNTYVADFHGTTVMLFERQSPDMPSNKPVCYDCHGVHNIRKVNDPASTVFKKGNLLKTCEQCHPDATEITFTEAWMSHYDASPEKWPLVYYVNLFYWVLIPVVIGGMALFVLLDIYRRVRQKFGGKT